MLDVKTRQAYLKTLGFYNGAVDGIAGKKTRAAYLALQQRYFTRAADIDGKYGNNTDILLRNAYNVAKHTKHFSLDEFRCKCKGEYCTGFPVLIDVQLLKNLQKLRDVYGATTITSGLRCKSYNTIVGGASASRHMTGKAADITNQKSKSLLGRQAIMKYWYNLSDARYTYCNVNGSYPNMGTSVHVDVR